MLSRTIRAVSSHVIYLSMTMISEMCGTADCHISSAECASASEERDRLGAWFPRGETRTATCRMQRVTRGPPAPHWVTILHIFSRELFLLSCTGSLLLGPRRRRDAISQSVTSHSRNQISFKEN